MEEVFSIEKWIKDSFNTIKVNWQEWLIVSAAFTVFWVGFLYILVRQLVEMIPSIVATPDNYVTLIIILARKLIIMSTASLIFSMFCELYMISRTYDWKLNKEFDLSITIPKVLTALPIALCLGFLYTLMSFIAFSLCILPIFIVSTYFFFLFHAYIIEDRGFESFGRSIDLVKNRFIYFLLIPIVFSIALQFAYGIPFAILRGIIELNLGSIDAPENFSPEKLVKVLLSPTTFLIISPVVFLLCLQSTLKSIFFTEAYIQCKEKEEIKNLPKTTEI